MWPRWVGVSQKPNHSECFFVTLVVNHMDISQKVQSHLVLLCALRALVVNHMDVSQKAQSHLVLLCALRALVVNYVDISQKPNHT